MDEKKQQDSDALPFVQVDRSVRGRAALLASRLKSTNQHALGSLIEWWDLCADPRRLEEIAAETPKGMDPAVILTKEAVELRFELASSHRVDAEVLSLLGLLEPVDGGKFRVRGMSRYFRAIRSRLRARSVASAGGKASVEARLKAGLPVRPGSQLVQESVQESVRESVHSRFTVGSQNSTDFQPEDRGQRTEDRGHTLEASFQLLSEAAVPDSKNPKKPKAKKRQPSQWEELWARLQEFREDRLLSRDRLPELRDTDDTTQVFTPQRINHLLSKAAEIVEELDPETVAGDPVETLRCLWERYLYSSFWAKAKPAFPLEGFATEKTLQRCLKLFCTPQDPTETHEVWL